MPSKKLFKRLRPGDVGVVLLCLGTVLSSAAQFLAPAAAERAVITAAGQTVVTLPLDRSHSFEIFGPLGLTRIETQPGRARVSQDLGRSSQCVDEGWLSQPGEAVACGPSQVTLSLEPASESER